MPWEEFKQLLSGIAPDTPLGRIVSIRAEEDPEVLKNFTPEQRRIQTEWRNKMARNTPEEARDRFLDEIMNTVYPGCYMPGYFYQMCCKAVQKRV